MECRPSGLGRVFHCVRVSHHTFIRRVARRDFVEGSSGIAGASGSVPPRAVRGFRGIAIVVVAAVFLSPGGALFFFLQPSGRPVATLPPSSAPGAGTTPHHAIPEM